MDYGCLGNCQIYKNCQNSKHPFSPEDLCIIAFLRSSSCAARKRRTGNDGQGKPNALGQKKKTKNNSNNNNNNNDRMLPKDLFDERHEGLGLGHDRVLVDATLFSLRIMSCAS